MKFTKVLYRDIDINGERWTVAMGPRGVYARPAGKRRWKAVHWAAILEVIADYEGQPEENDPPVQEPLAAVEDGKGQGREPGFTSDPAQAPVPPQAQDIGAVPVAAIAVDQAERWTSKLRDLVVGAMKAKIEIDEELVSLGKWLRSQAERAS